MKKIKLNDNFFDCEIDCSNEEIYLRAGEFKYIIAFDYKHHFDEFGEIESKLEFADNIVIAAHGETLEIGSDILAHLRLDVDELKDEALREMDDYILLEHTDESFNMAMNEAHYWGSR